MLDFLTLSVGQPFGNLDVLTEVWISAHDPIDCGVEDSGFPVFLPDAAELDGHG